MKHFFSTDENSLLKAKTFQFENPKNVIVGDININFVRNKSELLKPFFYNSFDILLALKTKIDSSFPNSEFFWAGYRMFRYDRESFGGGLWFYLNESIPLRKTSFRKDDGEKIFSSSKPLK